MLKKLAFLLGYKEAMEKAAAILASLEDLPNVGDSVVEVKIDDIHGDHIYTLEFDSGRSAIGHFFDPETMQKAAAICNSNDDIPAVNDKVKSIERADDDFLVVIHFESGKSFAGHIMGNDTGVERMVEKKPVLKSGSQKLDFLRGYSDTMEKVAEMTAADKDIAASVGIMAGTTAGGLATKAWMKKMLAKGMSAQDLAKASEIAEKYKLKVPLKYTSGMAPQYNPFTKAIHVNMGLSEALHEIGHARAYRRYGKLAIPMVITRRAAPTATGLAGIAMALSDDETASRNAPWVAASGSLPTLIDEALASGLALKDMKKLYGWKGVAKGLKKLTPGYLSYLRRPAANAFLPLLLRGIKRKTEEPSSVVDKAASITRDYEYLLGYVDTLQKVAAKGITSDLTTLSHSESDLRPDTKPQRSQAPSISSSMRGLMGGSQSAASFSPAAAESTGTSTPGSSFDFGAVRGAKVRPFTGDEIRSATPEEMLTSRSLERPWYNQEAPKTLREAGTVAAEILSNLYAPRPSVALRTDASGIEHFI